jgi:Flp pilus assembly protein TadD
MISPQPVGPSSDAEALTAYEEGRRAFQARELEVAHAAFARAYRRDGRDPRFMSWHGVMLVLVERNSNLGVQLCDQALRAGGPEPELLLNLARVHLALGQRERVAQVVARGLERWPDDPGLLAAHGALGSRRRPVLPFLSREHPWNRALGRLRHRLVGSGPSYELSPIALGTPPPPPDAGERS